MRVEIFQEGGSTKKGDGAIRGNTSHFLTMKDKKITFFTLLQILRFKLGFFYKNQSNPMKRFQDL